MTEKDHYKYGLSGDKVPVELAERFRSRIRELEAQLAAEKSRLPALGDGYEQLWLRAKTAEDRIRELEAELAGTKDELYSVDKAAKELGEQLAASERYRENLAQGHVDQAERIRELEAESTDHWEWRRRMGAEAEADHANISKLEAELAAAKAIISKDDNTESYRCAECGAWHVRKPTVLGTKPSLHLHWCGSHIGRECNCHSSKETATWDCVCGSTGHKRGARCLCGGVYENSAVETKGDANVS